MLFSEPVFLLAFLPAVLAGFYLIAGVRRPQLTILWLLGASLFFYGWWRLDFLPLLLASALFNYGYGLWLAKSPTRVRLAFGVGINLAAIGWFKYSGFMAGVINDLSGWGIPMPQVLLPLAISFYTFQQIAYLVDAYAGEARETSLSRYLLFVAFFPQLIAGPIVHHREILGQFERLGLCRPEFNSLLLGVTAFSIGLFKKVVIADPLGGVTGLAFAPAADGVAPHFADAWIGALAYSLQLYFDFSGYSDMAVGLGLMFGIRLPINFASPYKAASIIEFWSRWHMTLTRFLTAYVYNPIVLSLTRRRVAAGKPLLRRSTPSLGAFIVLLAIPTLITMFLAGIWHGAGWQYIIFGVLHGVMLVVNHAWRALRQTRGIEINLGGLGRPICVLVTFLAVTVTLVFFKSASVDQALAVIRGLVGLGGERVLATTLGGPDLASMNALELLIARLTSFQGALIIVALAFVWLLPNTARYLELISGVLEQRRERPTPAQPLIFRFRWPETLVPRGTFVEGGVIGGLLALALLRAISVAPTEFLYFTF